MLGEGRICLESEWIDQGEDETLGEEIRLCSRCWVKEGDVWRVEWIEQCGKENEGD